MKYHWTQGTAFDFFMSLDVLHDPAKYGLRGSWAAGVRSRIPTEKRDILQVVMKSRIWAIPWVATLPEPRNGRVVLEALANIPAGERFRTITACYLDVPNHQLLSNIAAKAHWSPADLKELKAAFQARQTRSPHNRRLTEDEMEQMLAVWAESAKLGHAWLAALSDYYDAFFAEEESRIEVALTRAVSQAKARANRLTLPELLEELSQGLRFTELLNVGDIIMVPSFWITPLSLFIPVRINGTGQRIFMFGARPPTTSLVPGDKVPDALYLALKALSNPTRLRIMRYLVKESMTPAELARRLRLRPPTVIHHLDAMRLARLVHLTIGPDGKKYTIRSGAIEAACDGLLDYLDSSTN